MLDLENVTAEELKKGCCTTADGALVCLHCGKTFEPDEVFPCGERYFTAEKAVRMHLETDHPDRFRELIDSGSKYLSLTDNQKELFLLFYSGMTDAEIAAQLGVSASTVRHQKFMFRERAKAARFYLAVWGMVEENKNKQAGLLPVHKGATMVDERYEITEEENKKILENVFKSLEPLKLKVFSPKEKKKIVILRKIAGQFEPGKQYTEKEVNAILKDIFDDYATLRRYLVEYGYMERTSDCRSYWLK